MRRNGFFQCIGQELRNDGAFLLRAAFVAVCTGALVAVVLAPVVVMLRLLGKCT